MQREKMDQSVTNETIFCRDITSPLYWAYEVLKNESIFWIMIGKKYVTKFNIFSKYHVTSIPKWISFIFYAIC